MVNSRLKGTNMRSDVPFRPIIVSFGHLWYIHFLYFSLLQFLSFVLDIPTLLYFEYSFASISSSFKKNLTYTDAHLKLISNDKSCNSFCIPYACWHICSLLPSMLYDVSVENICMTWYINTATQFSLQEKVVQKYY